MVDDSRREAFVNMELQDSTLCFLYDQLRVETIRYLEDYIRSERGTLAELKDRFRRSLPEEDRRRVRTVKKLVDTLEERSVIGPNNVELLKMLAEALELQKLKDKIEKFETKCAGIFQRTLNAAGSASGFIWQKFKGAICTSAIHLKTVLSTRGVPILAGAAFMYIYNTNPEKLKDLQPFVDFGADVIAVLRGSVVFVLKFSSISSLKRLWQSYKDGSLKKKLKTYFNETKELKEFVSRGTEIDVEVTIDEEEYREALLDLILLEVKGNSTKSTKTQRRHSICCGRDVPEESNKPMDVTQIQIRVGRPIIELEKSIDGIKRLKKRLAKGLSKTAKFEEERLSEIRRQLSEMEIFLAAAGFSEIRFKEAENIRLAEDVKRNIPLVKKRKSSEESGWQTKSLSEYDEEGPSGYLDYRPKKRAKKRRLLEDLGIPRKVLPFTKGESSLESALPFVESMFLETEVERGESFVESEWQLMESMSEDEGVYSSTLRRSRRTSSLLRDAAPRRSRRTSSLLCDANILQLREYQKELAEPALGGKNTIICSPTNIGKTFVAMEIAKRHLDYYKSLKSNEVKSPKVIFVMDKPNLLNQRIKLFKKYLTNYNISAISAYVARLHRIIQDNDVIVLAAQILVNALEDKSVDITDISLLVFDECDHDNKLHPINQIMQEYLKLKINGSSEPKKLPQVVGLTASLDTTTKEQVLQMCANLDASNISTVRRNVEELKRFSRHVYERKKTQVEKKPNIFEKEINKAMEEIEASINEAPPKATNRQVESYRKWIEALGKKQGEGNQLTCTSVLRCYHEALLINSNVRIKDAVLYLDEYFNTLDKSKFDETESWLHELFLKTKEPIEKHIQEAGMPENPLLVELQKILVDFHAKKVHGKSKAKGILFPRTRDYAHALKKWIEETEEVNKILRPEVLPADVAALTQSQKEQVIKNFKKGTVNIIIATSIAEEGLDISDCSYVIRYGMLQNEITSVSSIGYMVAKRGKRRNKYKEMLFELVLEDINDIPTEEFLKMIHSRQFKSVASEKETPTLEAMKMT